nr:DapH/DapD/GlmU-related protein [Escherichia coli]
MVFFLNPISIVHQLLFLRLGPLESAPVYIGERVWIGENVTILPGACIGNGVVIGANSVVRGGDS